MSLNQNNPFYLKYEEVRHGQKTWRVYCKWDHTLVRDVCFHYSPDNYAGAELSLNMYIERVLSGEIKGKPEIKEKIIEFYLLINE